MLIILFIFKETLTQLSQQAVGLPSQYSITTTVCSRTSIQGITQSHKTAGQSLLSSMPSFDYNPVTAYLHTDDTIPTVINKSLSYYINYIIPSAVGLFILITSTVYLLAVSCCPASCPTNACRSSQDQYSRYQLGWPTIFSIILSLTILCVSIPSIIKSSSFINSLNYVGCQSMSLNDHLINGRLGNNNSVFFAGISKINQSTNSIKPQLNTFSTNAQTALANGNTLLTTGNNALKAIQDLYTNYSDISYTNAFRTSTSIHIASVQSQFKNLFLGPKQNTNSISGSFYSNLQPMTTNISGTVTPMLAASSTIKTSVDDGTMDIRFNQAINAMNTFNQSIFSFMNIIQKVFSRNNGYSGVKYGLMTFYILLILVATVAMFSILAIFLCGVFQFRKCAFCALGFYIFLAFLGFIIAIFLGITLPTTYFSCSQIGLGITNRTHLQESLNKMGLQKTASSALSTVVQDGQIISKIHPDFATDYSNFKILFDNAIDFQNRTSLFSSSSIDNTNTSIYQIINKVYQNHQYDINDTDAINWLNLFASGQIATSSTCNSNAQSDSWVPSFSNPNPVCRSGIVSRALCNNISSTSVCQVGCYPFTQQLSNVSSGDTNPSLWYSRLQTRYNSAGAASDCNFVTFVFQLKNEWDNPRQAKLNTLRSDIQSSGNVIPTITSYKNQMSNILGTVKTYATSLDNTIPSIVNSTSGVMAGLNASVLKTDLTNLYGGACYIMLNDNYFLYISMLIICFCITIGNCMMVCSIYRHGRMYQYIIFQTMKIHAVVDDTQNDKSDDLM